MNADREPNRLPLRAGAMMLFAVAVVFIGLGWHSAATSGSEPQATETTATATPAPASTTSSTSAVTTTKRVCVINAGQVSGLASDVSDLLKEKGYTMAQPGNYTAGGFSENTIFYDSDSDKAQAEELAETLGGTVSVEERPSSFTRCKGGVPVIVVNAVSGS
ncbi:LytR family transcriptional regulator [Gordonia rubripertincta]|uniref:LytR C-terminal domain-containing protein n=1 Tax=Gordonia rubripertincta TaxID=36822 RepID=UPI0011816E59|nr:LytR C-terminal domain-containing protein [Gordonia rubripertincta]QMU22322.1 LytR C-terminal domain-containing protein [Gordonia rubripertincta]TSD94145.1 LytR family transcriptional regulator [Gordonia rubripertincta]